MADFYPDYQKDFGPGAGGTAQPGAGLTTNNAISDASGSLTNSVPGEPGGMNDVLRQMTGLAGNAQGGSVGERVSSTAREFADPTIGNIARAIMTGLSVASPLGPFNIAAGEAIDQLHMPEIASPALGVASQMLGSFTGLPFSPHALPTFTGEGAFPPEFRQMMEQATTPQEMMRIHSLMQAYQETHGSNAPTHDFSAGGPGGDIAGGVGAAMPGGEIGGGVMEALKNALAGGALGNAGGGGGNAGGGPIGSGQHDFGGQGGRAGF